MEANPASDPAPAPDPDPFDALLTLETQYYAEGHALGVADGARAGRLEGRVFGLEKGFEKFAAMGALHGRAAVWAARLPSKNRATDSLLPPLPANPRLARHVEVLHALSEPASLSTQNDEGAVSDFDDRYKRARAKAKMVARMAGEGADAAGAELEGEAASAGRPSSSSSSPSSSTGRGPKRVGGGAAAGVKMVRRERPGEERNMEDFGAIGSRQS